MSNLPGIEGTTPNDERKLSARLGTHAQVEYKGGRSTIDAMVIVAIMVVLLIGAVAVIAIIYAAKPSAPVSEIAK